MDEGKGNTDNELLEVNHVKSTVTGVIREDEENKNKRRAILAKWGVVLALIVLISLYHQYGEYGKTLKAHERSLELYRIKSDTTFLYLLDRYGEGRPLADSLRSLASLQLPAQANLLQERVSEALSRQREWGLALRQMIHQCETGPVRDELGFGIDSGYQQLYYVSQPLQKDLMMMLYSMPIEGILSGIRHGTVKADEQWASISPQLLAVAGELGAMDQTIVSRREMILQRYNSGIEHGDLLKTQFLDDLKSHLERMGGKAPPKRDP